MFRKWFRKRRLVIEVEEEIYAWCPAVTCISRYSYGLPRFAAPYYGMSVSPEKGSFSLTGEAKVVNMGLFGSFGL